MNTDILNYHLQTLDIFIQVLKKLCIQFFPMVDLTLSVRIVLLYKKSALFSVNITEDAKWI